MVLKIYCMLQSLRSKHFLCFTISRIGRIKRKIGPKIYLSPCPLTSGIGYCPFYGGDYVVVDQLSVGVPIGLGVVLGPCFVEFVLVPCLELQLSC